MQPPGGARRSSGRPARELEYHALLEEYRAIKAEIVANVTSARPGPPRRTLPLQSRHHRMTPLPRGGGETVVERGYDRLRSLSGEQHAAVGKLENSPGSEDGKTQMCIVTERHGSHPELIQGRGRPVQLT